MSRNDLNQADTQMMAECYLPATAGINRQPRWLFPVLLLLGAALCLPAPSGAQELGVLEAVVAFVRAHPSASGRVTLVRYIHAHGRTTSEPGFLRVSASGALLRLGAPETPRFEMSIRPDRIETFDAGVSPPLVLIARGETPLARLAAVAAGEAPSVHLRERILERARGHVRAEVVPSAPWPGLERLVVDVLDEGPERGRVVRCLWLDGLGNWQRLDLEGLRFAGAAASPAGLDLSPHPEARRVEL